MGAKVKADWVVGGGRPGETASCKRCGQGLKLGGPQPVSVFIAASNAFVKLHSRCPDIGRVEPPVRNPLEWAIGNDTGISSMTIWSVMTGEHSRYSCYDIPYDPADFGRCYRLLKLFPIWRENLDAVAKTYSKWKPFVREWDRLTEMFERQDRTMYEFMKELRNEAQ